MIIILDFIFVIHLTFMVIAAGIEIINGHILDGMKTVGKGVVSLAFFMAALGHFLFGYPVKILFQRYLAEGYKLIPLLYKEYISPIFDVIKP
ncbi:MAG: hypothetical protein KGZ58_07130 [Ignavibacteriales bacterium]|nr:hypothetical protein [Ignavibacteriales bacterium]